MRLTTTLVLLAVLFSLAGCFNEADQNNELDLGNVSLGQQLIDLERARDTGAMTDAEYKAARTALLEFLDNLADTESDEDDDDRDQKPAKPRASADKKDDEDDGFKWF